MVKKWFFFLRYWGKFTYSKKKISGDNHPGDNHPGDNHPGDNHPGDV